MRQFLENLTGLSIYPLLSLGIFIAAFVAAVMHACFIDKSIVDDMENLPLSSDIPEQA